MQQAIGLATRSSSLTSGDSLHRELAVEASHYGHCLRHSPQNGSSFHLLGARQTYSLLGQALAESAGLHCFVFVSADHHRHRNISHPHRRPPLQARLPRVVRAAGQHLHPRGGLRSPRWFRQAGRRFIQQRTHPPRCLQIRSAD